MVTVHRGLNWKIAVYGREHGIPHFHIEGRNFRCSVGIKDLEVIVGTAPADALEAGRLWANTHRRELVAKWQELNE